MKDQAKAGALWLSLLILITGVWLGLVISIILAATREPEPPKPAECPQPLDIDDPVMCIDCRCPDCRCGCISPGPAKWCLQALFTKKSAQ